MLELPFFAELKQGRRILIAGAGGGYDIFCGLPLFFALRNAGYEVHLANLSFTSLDDVAATRLTPELLTVDADSWTRDQYFPEGYLSRWFRARGDSVPIYTFKRTGVIPLRRSYEKLVELLNLDTLVLVDGGTDSLMRGDEEGLGTPHEDMASVAAANRIGIPRKLLVCLGFGVDTFHGVCHAHFLEAVAEISRGDGYLGAMSLLRTMPEVSTFIEATEFVFDRMPRSISIVSSSIISAIEGHYGDHHRSPRTAGSELYINPLMGLYWFFNLDVLARRVMYLDRLDSTHTIQEVDMVINLFRRQLATQRAPKVLPM